MGKGFKVRCKYHPEEWFHPKDGCPWCADEALANQTRKEQEEEDRLNQEFRDRYLKAFGKLPI